MKTQTKAWSGSDTIRVIRDTSRRCRFGLLLIIMAGVAMFCGCQAPTMFETSVSLLPVTIESEDPNTPPVQVEPPDALDVLVAVEKIAGKAGLKPYTSSYEEVSLLDMADSDDLLDDANTNTINVSEWKHPELPVYLTVTRKPEEILILLNHTPEAGGKANSDAVKLFKAIGKQLSETKF